jgi:hypothetical protein
MKGTIVIKKLQWIKLAFVILISGTSASGLAQVTASQFPLGQAITIYTVQQLSFGAFSHNNSGGSITISSTGSRWVSGGIVALNLGQPYYQAIVEIEAPMGTSLSILNGPDAMLSGSNGGSMAIHIGDTNPSSPLRITASPPNRTQIHIGATLTVGNSAANPPGNYTGSFYIIFNQE